PPWPVQAGWLQRLGQHDAAESGNEPDRQVDLTEQQREDLSHRQHADQRGLDEQVHEVGGGEEMRVLRLKDDRDEQEPGDHRQDTRVTPADPGERHPEVLGDRARHELGRNREVLSRRARFVLVAGAQARGRLVDFGHQAAPPADGADRVDAPLVIRSTTICRSTSAIGRTATMRPRYRTAIRSATWKTSFRLCETSKTAW